MTLLRGFLRSRIVFFLLFCLGQIRPLTGQIKSVRPETVADSEFRFARTDPPTTLPSTTAGGIQYVNASVDIPSAYAALPPTGGVVTLQNDITISTPKTLSMTIGKPLKLDCGGHTITCANPSNNTICLTIAKPDSNPRYRLEVAGGSCTYTFSGSATGITGLKIQGVDSSHGATDFSVHDLHFAGFNTSSSVAIDLGGAEEAEVYANSFTENAVGMTAGLNFNNNYIHGNSFHHNTVAFIFTDVLGVNFDSNLMQSNGGSRPAQFISSALGLDTLIFTNNWFENNRDGTANSRTLSFNIGAGTAMGRMQLVGNTFAPGANTPNTST
jgi:hypothetical protein